MIRSSIKATLLTALVGGSVGWSPLLMANQGAELLKGMQSAVHALNYKGRLVFSRGSELSEYQIEHVTGQGGAGESVIKLDKGNSADTDQAQFSLVNSHVLRLPAQQAYTIDVGGNAEVAGIPCKVVVVRPRDKMRYLHRYCINQDNGMLLRYSVMNRQQQLLEQFMFTQLTIDDPTLQASALIQPVALAASEQDSGLSGEATLGESSLQHWQLGNLPAGFKLGSVKDIPGKTNAKQLVLSDGLTFVSIFIEPGSQAANQSQQFPASGATNILTREIEGFTVTLVGEVPQSTLQSIQNGLRYVTP